MADLRAGSCSRPRRSLQPDNAPLVKRKAVAGYGAEIHLCESTNAAREVRARAPSAAAGKLPRTPALTPAVTAQAAAKRMMQETGAVFVHPSNDPRVAAGQGTAGLELVEQAADAGGCAPRAAWNTPAHTLSRSHTPGGLDAVIVPIGGGGLISGISTAVKVRRRWGLPSAHI